MENLKLRKQKVKSIIKELKKLFPKAQTALEYSSPWELLVAVILSARNTDKKVNEITKDLFKKYKTIEDYKNADLKDLEKDLSALGLFRQKAKFVKTTAEMIFDR